MGPRAALASWPPVMVAPADSWAAMEAAGTVTGLPTLGVSGEGRGTVAPLGFAEARRRGMCASAPWADRWVSAIGSEQPHDWRLRHAHYQYRRDERPVRYS
jgi:hypothetical protein